MTWVRSAFVSVFAAMLIPAQQPPAPPAPQVLSIAPQITLRYTAPWKTSGAAFQNAHELVLTRTAAVRPEGATETQNVEYPQARVLITTEQRSSHDDALKRLQDIAKSRSGTVHFLQLGGWPAVQLEVCRGAAHARRPTTRRRAGIFGKPSQPAGAAGHCGHCRRLDRASFRYFSFAGCSSRHVTAGRTARNRQFIPHPRQPGRRPEIDQNFAGKRPSQTIAARQGHEPGQCPASRGIERAAAQHRRNRCFRDRRGRVGDYSQLRRQEHYCRE